jgi:hypothetical protein
MASIINASTSTGLVTTADTSGVLQLQTGGTTAVTISSGQVATFAQAPVLPAASIPQAALAAGVAGTGPAFSAYANATQSITTTTFTKVAINTEEFDTNNNFDTTNNRFTPTVAGYYQVNGLVRCTGSAPSQIFSGIFKNGSAYARGTEIVGTSLTISNLSCSISEIIYMNGTTDYVELYGFVTATSPTFNFSNSTATSRFSASMVRAA